MRAFLWTSMRNFHPRFSKIFVDFLRDGIFVTLKNHYISPTSLADIGFELAVLKPLRKMLNFKKIQRGNPKVAPILERDTGSALQAKS